MYIIDGHNLLHTIIKLDELFKPVTDIQMCRIINGFLKLTGQTGELIFDGSGPKEKNAYENLSHLEVFFAGGGMDADTIIENKIKADSAPKRLIIVSSDRRLRKAALVRKAASIKSDEFWTALNKQLDKKRPEREPDAKRQGLSESETKHWLKIFGIEQ
jgi:predicted RNA-binding protein with PIN domain